MSVASTDRLAYEAGNGVKYQFDFAFKVLSAADLKVRRVTAAGVVSSFLTNGVDYTVTFDSAAETGTVSYQKEDPLNPGSYIANPVENGGYSIIERSMTLTQPTVFPRESPTPAKTTEKAHDREVLQIQDLDARLDRALVQENSYAPASIGVAAPVDARGLKYKDNGDGTWTVEPSDHDLDTMLDDALVAQAAAEAAQTGAEAAQTAAVAARNAAQTAQTGAVTAKGQAETARDAALAAQAAAEAAEVGAAAAASAAVNAQVQEGLASERPAAPATRVEYYATDTGELSIWRPTAGRWFTIG